MVNNWSQFWSHGRTAANGSVGKWPSCSSLWAKCCLPHGICKGLCVQCHSPGTQLHGGHSFLQGKCPDSLLSLASAVLKPLWQLIRSKALLTCASLGDEEVFGALFWICIVRDNRLLALETNTNATHLSCLLASTGSTARIMLISILPISLIWGYTDDCWGQMKVIIYFKI